MLTLKFCSRLHSLPINRKPLFAFTDTTLKSFSNANVLRLSSSASSCSAMSFQQTHNFSASTNASLSIFEDSPLPGLESDLVGYVFGKKKATEVAHLACLILETVNGNVKKFIDYAVATCKEDIYSFLVPRSYIAEAVYCTHRVWKHVVRKGDIVVDATCGNGYDTLAMLKLVADESGTGCVYGLDVQGEALDNTSSLLDETVNRAEKQLVKLFNICHSKIEEVVPKDTSVRLVAFNLGYLPGGDKTVITKSETTLMALEAAERILIQGGLISMVVYVGHPGGREELETVEAFASRLSVDNWICCKFQMLNRPLAPVLVFLFKR
ncbi:hypothetical protein JRO89_XS11G0227600 [Xanthoceras sorbifolium]|uniref:rRNA methylase YtqB n=1 Tax=Xanthoceras sorbifolium TaxID=99658 RepID=A0ABQ8HGV6_9ROSI|nr:hypothetical protein JRO89_XS11G0227600 [Xanthoceras sorbifolium]